MSCICGSRKSILKGCKNKIPSRITVTDHYTDLIQKGEVDPEKAAIIGDHGRILFTSLQLDLHANKVAKAIRKYLGYWTNNNLDGDLVIGFCLHTTEHAILIMLATMKLGATYLSLGTSYPEHQIVRIVGLTRPLLLVTEADPLISSKFDCVKHICEIVSYDDLHEAGQQSFDDPNDPVPLEALAPPWRRAACIVFTAGTIGEPHGVRIGHQAILNRLYWQFKVLPYQYHEVACLSSLLVDAESVAEIFAPLLGSIPLFVIPRHVMSKPGILFATIKELTISRITLTPTYFNNVLKLIKQGAEDGQEVENTIDKDLFESIRYIIISGDILPYDMGIQFFLKVNPHHKGAISLVFFYGASETTSEATYEVFEDESDFKDKAHQNEVSGGQPIHNTQIYIMDEDLNIVPRGMMGEICISGTSLAMGYCDNRDNDARFVLYPPNKNKKGTFRLFRTGDFGKLMVADGIAGSRLYYQGRTDMVMKVGGKEIQLNEIATAVYNSKLCNECAVLCYHRDREDQNAVAFCIMGADTDPSVLIEFLKKSLDDFMIPDVYPVTQLPYLPSGRLDRQKLVKMYKYRRMESTPEEWNALNLDVAEKQASKVLSEAISHTIGVALRTILTNWESSYWSIGGNSLNALTIVHTIRQNGYLISIDEFVKADSISSITKAMVQSSRSPVSDGELLMHICDLAESKYTMTPLKQEHKSAVVQLISKSHSQRGVMSKIIGATQQDYIDYVELVWDIMIKEDLSVVAVDIVTEKISGVALCTDVNTKHLRSALKHVRKPMSYCVEAFHACELSVRQTTINKDRGTTLQIFMVGTDVSMESRYNILLVEFLLKGSMQRGLLQGFSWVLILDVSTLIRDLCGTVLRYDLIAEQKLNSYVSRDKIKPFRHAEMYQAVRAYYRFFA